MKPFLTGISVCLIICTMITTVSCVKSTPTGGKSDSTLPTAGGYLSSIRDDTKFTSQIDSFKYDNANRLTGFTVTGANPTDHSGGKPVITFTYSGSNTAPGSYTISSPDGKNSLHQLSYDGQNRITRDSVLDGSGFVTSWSYPNGNIASATKGGPGGQFVDTLFLSSGNISEQHSYSANNAGVTEALISTKKFTYIAGVNPCYHSAIANTIGPLLNNLVINNGATDFVSGNGINSITIHMALPGLPGTDNIQSFSWTTDSKGRAATLAVTDSQLGAVGNLTFSYY